MVRTIGRSGVNLWGRGGRDCIYCLRAAHAHPWMYPYDRRGERGGDSPRMRAPERAHTYADRPNLQRPYGNQHGRARPASLPSNIVHFVHSFPLLVIAGSSVPPVNWDAPAKLVAETGAASFDIIARACAWDEESRTSRRFSRPSPPVR